MPSKSLKFFVGKYKHFFGVVMAFAVVLASIGVSYLANKQPSTDTRSDAAGTNDGRITVSNGDFYLNGQKFFVVGTNWNASYANSPNYFISQPANIFADPYYTENKYVVEAELADMQSLGYNTLSVQWPIFKTTATNAPSVYTNVKDFIARVKAHGLKLSTYLPVCDAFPSSYIAYDESYCSWMVQNVKSIVAPQDLFAIEVVWEPGQLKWSDSFDNPGWNQLDTPWKNWINERYGNAANAMQNWGYNSIVLPKWKYNSAGSNWYAEYLQDNADSYGIPTARNRAFKRFFSDYYAKKVNTAVTVVKNYFPGVLVSGRSTSAPAWGEPFPLEAVASSFDFIALEGWGFPYGPSGGVSNQTFLGNGLYIEYAKTVSKGKPLVIYEFGMNTLDNACMNPARKNDPACLIANPIDKQQTQATLYAQTYDLAKRTNISGIMNWFHVGKRPVSNWADSEYSDYGIRELPAKGTTTGLGNKKLAWNVVQTNVPGFKSKSTRSYTGSIPVDPQTKSADSFLTEKGPQFGSSLSSGQYPRIVSPGTDTNSFNTPDLCVGNKPYGNCAHAYLNSYFDYIEVLNSSGGWQRVGSGTTVNVVAGQPVHVRARVTNNGEASWLNTSSASNSKGLVQFGGNENLGSILFRKNIPSVVSSLGKIDIPDFTISNGVTQTSKVVFQMSAAWKAWFGEQISINLQPVQSTIPVPPSGLVSSCSENGLTGTLQWNAVSFATYYAIRVDNKVDAWTGSCTSAGGDFCKDVPTNSYTFNTTPGSTYDWWVHAMNSAGGSGTSMKASFTCPKLPTPTATNTPVITKSPTPTIKPTFTPVNTPTPTKTPTGTPTSTPKITLTPIATTTPTKTPTVIPTKTPTPKVTVTPVATGTPTPSQSTTPTKSPTPSVSQTPAPTCPRKGDGDADCNGSIDLLDFEKFREEYLAHKGDTNVIGSSADFNNDKSIDLLDFELFRQGYLKDRGR